MAQQTEDKVMVPDLGIVRSLDAIVKTSELELVDLHRDLEQTLDQARNLEGPEQLKLALSVQAKRDRYERYCEVLQGVTIATDEVKDATRKGDIEDLDRASEKLAPALETLAELSPEQVDKIIGLIDKFGELEERVGKLEENDEVQDKRLDHIENFLSHFNGYTRYGEGPTVPPAEPVTRTSVLPTQTEEPTDEPEQESKPKRFGLLTGLGSRIRNRWPRDAQFSKKQLPQSPAIA